MTETPVSQETPEDEPSFWDKIDQRIADTLGKLFDTGQATVAESGKPGGDPAHQRPGAEVGAEVKQAMADVLRAEEDRKKAEGKNAELEAARAEVARLKALVEKPPEQERRIERIMGWRT